MYVTNNTFIADNNNTVVTFVILIKVLFIYLHLFCGSACFSLTVLLNLCGEDCKVGV